MQSGSEGGFSRGGVGCGSGAGGLGGAGSGSGSGVGGVAGAGVSEPGAGLLVVVGSEPLPAELVLQVVEPSVNCVPPLSLALTG